MVVEDEEVMLAEDDLVLIEPEEKYFWKGNLIMFVASNPSWYPKQHKNIE